MCHLPDQLLVTMIWAAVLTKEQSLIDNIGLQSSDF